MPTEKLTAVEDDDAPVVKTWDERLEEGVSFPTEATENYITEDQAAKDRLGINFDQIAEDQNAEVDDGDEEV